MGKRSTCGFTRTVAKGHFAHHLYPAVMQTQAIYLRLQQSQYLHKPERNLKELQKFSENFVIFDGFKMWEKQNFQGIYAVVLVFLFFFSYFYLKIKKVKKGYFSIERVENP